MIPKNILEEILDDPFYKSCSRTDSKIHDGRITLEHSLTYQGRKLEEKFAIIPLCWYCHLGLGLDKRKNREIALKRMDVKDLAKYPSLRKSNGFAYLDKE